MRHSLICFNVEPTIHCFGRDDARCFTRAPAARRASGATGQRPPGTPLLASWSHPVQEVCACPSPPQAHPRAGPGRLTGVALDKRSSALLRAHPCTCCTKASGGQPMEALRVLRRAPRPSTRLGRGLRSRTRALCGTRTMTEMFERAHVVDPFRAWLHPWPVHVTPIQPRTGHRPPVTARHVRSADGNVDVAPFPWRQDVPAAPCRVNGARVDRRLDHRDAQRLTARPGRSVGRDHAEITQVLGVRTTTWTAVAADLRGQRRLSHRMDAAASRHDEPPPLGGAAPLAPVHGFACRMSVFPSPRPSLPAAGQHERARGAVVARPQHPARGERRQKARPARTAPLLAPPRPGRALRAGERAPGCPAS